MNNFFFGEGIDFKFYIPWFEYRGLNVNHHSVDSFYWTFFVKHGVFGMGTILGAILFFLRSKPWPVVMWVLVYLITHNGPYLPSFLIMLVFLLIFDWSNGSFSRK